MAYQCFAWGLIQKDLKPQDRLILLFLCDQASTEGKGEVVIDKMCSRLEIDRPAVRAGLQTIHKKKLFACAGDVYATEATFRYQLAIGPMETEAHL